MGDVQPRRDDAGRELTERAQRRPGQGPRRDPLDERHQRPPVANDEEQRRLEQHAAGNDPRRRLVDRVGEGEELPGRRHAANATDQIPTRLLMIRISPGAWAPGQRYP